MMNAEVQVLLRSLHEPRACSVTRVRRPRAGADRRRHDAGAAAGL